MPQIAASAGIFPWLMERRRSSSPLWLWLRLCPSSNFMRSLRWIPTLLFRRQSTAYVFPCIRVDLQENFSGSRIQIDNPCALLPG
jgi:hypothetical protein